MKSIKYNRYFFIIFLFFLLWGQKNRVYAAEVGFTLGATYQSFAFNNSSTPHEQSSFGIDMSVIGIFLPHPRIMLIPEIGFSDYISFYTIYLGLKLGFVLYPKYLPFIGITAREHYYSNIIDKTNQFVTSLYFSMGSEIYKWKNNALWVFFDYLIIDSTHVTITSSRFTLSFGYTYSFK